MNKQLRTKLKTGDNVYILTGKDKGKTGKIEKILLATGRVLVEGINATKKHVKPRGQQAGGIISINRPIHISNVQVVDPTTKKRTRISYELKGKIKTRLATKTKSPLEIKKTTKKKK